MPPFVAGTAETGSGRLRGSTRAFAGAPAWRITAHAIAKRTTTTAPMIHSRRRGIRKAPATRCHGFLWTSDTVGSAMVYGRRYWQKINRRRYLGEQNATGDGALSARRQGKSLRWPPLAACFILPVRVGFIGRSRHSLSMRSKNNP